MDFKKLYLKLIYSVWTFFQSIAKTGRKIADNRVMPKMVSATGLSERQIRRNLKAHKDGPGNAAVASVVDSLHGKAKKREA